MGWFCVSLVSLVKEEGNKGEMLTPLAPTVNWRLRVPEWVETLERTHLGEAALLMPAELFLVSLHTFSTVSQRTDKLNKLIN